MAYTYGDTRTSNNGIWIWLQGQRNRGPEGPNYLPKGLDINQTSNWVRGVIIKFCNDILGMEVTKKKYNRFKHPKLVQANFTKFVEFVKSNYQPQ